MVLGAIGYYWIFVLGRTGIISGEDGVLFADFRGGPDLDDPYERRPGELLEEYRHRMNKICEDGGGACMPF